MRASKVPLKYFGLLNHLQSQISWNWDVTDWWWSDSVDQCYLSSVQTSSWRITIGPGTQMVHQTIGVEETLLGVESLLSLESDLDHVQWSHEDWDQEWPSSSWHHLLSRSQLLHHWSLLSLFSDCLYSLVSSCCCTSNCWFTTFFLACLSRSLSIPACNLALSDTWTHIYNHHNWTHEQKPVFHAQCRWYHSSLLLSLLELLLML